MCQRRHRILEDTEGFGSEGCKGDGNRYTSPQGDKLLGFPEYSPPAG